RRRHTRSYGDWSSDVCSSDLRRDPAVVELRRTRCTGDAAGGAGLECRAAIRRGPRQSLPASDRSGAHGTAAAPDPLVTRRLHLTGYPGPSFCVRYTKLSAHISAACLWLAAAAWPPSVFS